MNRIIRHALSPVNCRRLNLVGTLLEQLYRSQLNFSLRNVLNSIRHYPRLTSHVSLDGSLPSSLLYSKLSLCSLLILLSALLLATPGHHLHRQQLAYIHLNDLAMMSPILERYKRNNGIPIMAYTMVVIFPWGVRGNMFP